MAKRGFTLSGVGIFITYIICMWMLAMVANVQKMQKKTTDDIELLKRSLVQGQAVVVDGVVTPEKADAIVSNIVEECMKEKSGGKP